MYHQRRLFIPSSLFSSSEAAPTNGSSFTYGGVTRIDIPSGMRNTYLDPSQTWLEFQLTPTFVTGGATNVAALDGSAHSLIRKVEVYSSAGSNLLESIDNVSYRFLLRSLRSSSRVDSRSSRIIADFSHLNSNLLFFFLRSTPCCTTPKSTC